jgi:hypothetical protein
VDDRTGRRPRDSHAGHEQLEIARRAWLDLSIGPRERVDLRAGNVCVPQERTAHRDSNAAENDEWERHTDPSRFPPPAEEQWHD